MPIDIINKVDHTPLVELSVTPTDETFLDMSQLNVFVFDVTSAYIQNSNFAIVIHACIL